MLSAQSDQVSVVINAENGSIVIAPPFVNSTANDCVSFNVRSTTESEKAENKKDNLANSDAPTEVLRRFLVDHKTHMKKKIEYIFEGKKDMKNKILLNKVYTQLYITKGELEDVNKEHEIMKLDKAFSVQKHQEKSINCNEIFSVPGTDEENRVVLTKGIAGIGKTVSVHKFILDWAEGKANQNIDCVFLLPFREINLIRNDKFTLHELLQLFHPEVEKVSEKDLYKSLKLAFVFDGLDESRLPLDFSILQVRSQQKKASVNDLISSLIGGDLLPSALVWITSRPAAAHQIPSYHVSLFTEVRGFSDRQKDEYFKKRIPDENNAVKIISQIKKSRSLYIMCHIPVFCWITATVLQEPLRESAGQETPTTLTEMYVHFLLIQMNVKNQKYDEKMERDLKKLLEMNRGIILKLAKLAFKQLTEGNIMFYEEDLLACGIEVGGVDSECSGMCAEIFKKESVLHEKKIYCFIHLSIQEFLAALHVFDSYLNKNSNELQYFFIERPPVDVQLHVLLKNAVDKAKASANGQLDLFLRFLLGISQESNHKLLHGIFTHAVKTKKSISKVIQYIRQLQNNSPALSPETSINHFFCLMELKDDSLYNQIIKYLDDKFPDRELSSSNCSALAYLMLVSGVVLEELDPKKFNPNRSAYLRLIPAVSCFRKAWLAGCELTETCWEAVVSALKVENSILTDLDLSDNFRVEKEVKLLSDALRSSHCKLQTLRLARCHFSQSGCAELTSALTSVSSSLRELDLSSNDLQDSGLELLLAGHENKYRKMEILRLRWCNLTQNSCSFLSSLLNTVTELDLSNNDIKDSGVKLISAELRNKHCKLLILRLSGCLVTEEGFCLLASALGSNSLSVLEHLDVSYNNPGARGETLLSELLNKPNCKLKMLKMEPKGERFIKAGIKKYVCNLTFNQNSAHTRLCVSESNRKVSSTDREQPYPEHPERFQYYEQVLCNESLEDRCYWEVYLEDSAPDIGVTYSTIQRNNSEGLFNAYTKLGLNPVSWVLCSFSDSRYFARHDSEDTDMNMPRSNRIGVYLDWPAGTLSFYNVAPDTHTLTHIHTFCTMFHNPVYPAFSVHEGALTLCQLE